jgi:hypothetical protein
MRRAAIRWHGRQQTYNKLAVLVSNGCVLELLEDAAQHGAAILDVDVNLIIAVKMDEETAAATAPARDPSRDFRKYQQAS